jgi:hypothetical protein
MKSGWISRAAKITAFVVLSMAGMGFLLMVLWNILIPEIFNGPQITFIQALGLLLLSRLLFMGFRPWGWKQHYKGKSEYWRRKFEEKVANMPPEQREKIKQAYARRCGWMREQNQPADINASQPSPTEEYSQVR